MVDASLMDKVFENPEMDIQSLIGGDPEPEQEPAVEIGESASTEVKEEDKSEEAEQQEEVEDQEETPQGIATKSGKGVIPYAVLTTERERRQAAEQAMAQMQQRLEQLTAQASGKESDDTIVEAIDSETLSEIGNDFPQIEKAFKSLQVKLQQTEAQLQQISSVESQRAVAEEANVRRTVAEAMDENPALLYWRDKEPDLFDQAVALDQQLESNPRFSHLSLTERFAKVVQAMEAIHGTTELPPEYQTTQTAEPKVSDKQLVERAKEAAAKVQSSKPRTLSDMPGGVAPTSDDAKLENMTTSELAGMLSKKSPDEIANFIARFG